MISIIFSWRSNRSNIACREISNGYRNTKGNPLCFGNYEQLLGDLGEFGPKNHRPPKFERFDRPEKMIEITYVFFLNHNSISSSCLKNQVGNVSERFWCRKLKIRFFVTDFPRGTVPTFLTSVPSLSVLFWIDDLEASLRGAGMQA